MPDTIPETEGADEGHTSDWTNGDFIEVADLRRSFGYLAATEKATLTLTNVMLSKSEANVKDIEIELLRTEEQCSAKTQQGRGLVIAMPPGVERPPLASVAPMRNTLPCTRATCACQRPTPGRWERCS